MQRNQQIEQAAWKYDRENPSLGSEDYKVEGFVAGANWADSHPHWHKFPENRPSETQPSSKKYYAACYDAHDKKSYADCFEWNGREFGRYTDMPIYDRDQEKVVAVQHEWDSYSHYIK